MKISDMLPDASERESSTLTTPMSVEHGVVQPYSNSAGQNPVDPPRRLGATNGVDWLREGWELFRDSPGIWTGILLTWIVLSAILSLIPLATNLLTSVFVGGLMQGCAALAAGHALSWKHLFAGFSHYFGRLIALGALTLAATMISIVLVGIVFLTVTAAVSVTPGAVFAFLMGLVSGQTTLVMPEALALLSVVMGLFSLFLMVSTLLGMAIWFAPALIVLHDMNAARAMKFSFRGCLANVKPLFLYGLTMMVLAILATIPFGLGWLVLGPVLLTSTYAAYKDIFSPQEW